jgi:hypothetical protein
MGILNRMAKLGAKHLGQSLGNKVRHDRSEAIREERYLIQGKNPQCSSLDLGKEPACYSIFEDLERGWKW